MVRNRRKKQAHRRRQSSGAPYTAAASHTAHHHPGPDLQPVDGSSYGVDGHPDLTRVTALLGACLAACRPCQQSLADAVLDGDRLVIAALADRVYGSAPVAGMLATPTTRALHALAVKRAGIRDGRALLAFVESLSREQLDDLLQDTLDRWSALDELADIASIAAAKAGEQGASAKAPEREPATLRTTARSQQAGGPGSPSHPPNQTPQIVAAYVLSPGVEHLLTEQERADLLRHAEASAVAGEPLTCMLCDYSADSAAEREIHVGLALRTLHRDGHNLDVLIPVWSHPRCARARIWAWAELEDERRRRGLPASDEHDEPGPSPTAGSDTTRTAEMGEADYTLFSLARLTDSIHPLVVIQPGRPHPYGLQGHLAEMLSYGLGPVDLSGDIPPPRLADWQMRCDRGRLSALTRRGAGTWYRQADGHPTPGEWRKAARAQRQALVLVLAPGTVADDGTDHRQALATVPDGHLLGGLMAITGTL
ncbi:hypothetical protein GCM10009733_006840 [Nonomuraea maheshkhaliensis]|uniref:DUF222 domain-containing protein n=1 Tax=Nonomuraea maheshkhaliensis TaxID=419590 RepID=A0ABN2EQQ0_9ACTN